jgi:3-deoxy-manno-octulosonate cytidylyltransferase (CMP-KDO synthetase)
LEKKLRSVMSKSKIIVCIPARYASTRFPGKVLAKDTGKFLIQHVYEQAKLAKLPSRVIIAADDKRIADAAKSFGADCITTSPDCPSGTDRIAQAVGGLDFDIVVNLQADEPELDPTNIDAVAKLLLENQKSKIKNQNCGMATLVSDFDNEAQIADPNIVKVVISKSAISNQQSAIYFSRSVIPYDREHAGIGPKSNYLRHLGIYAYRKDFLLKITKLPQTPLEKIEKLEQLRAVENGFEILVAKVKPPLLHFAKQSGGGGIDTPEQYTEFVKRYQGRKDKR